MEEDDDDGRIVHSSDVFEIARAMPAREGEKEMGLEGPES